VDTTHAGLDPGRMRNVIVEANTFNAVTDPFQSPISIEHQENSDTQVWTVDFSRHLPFAGYARNVTAIVPVGQITAGASARVGAGGQSDLIETTRMRSSRERGAGWRPAFLRLE